MLHSNRPPADVLLVGGTVMTMSRASAADGANAIALRGDRILAVGPQEQLRSLLAPGATVIDVGGATNLPGFHDSHVHLVQHGFEASQVNLASTDSLAQAMALIREAAKAAGPGEWIFGTGFAVDRWGVNTLHRRIGRAPRRERA